MKRYILRIVILLTVLTLGMLGCTKDPLPGNLSKPTLNAQYKDVSFNSVRLTCNISKTNYTEFGFWIGTKTNLSDKRTITAAVLSDGKKFAEAFLSDLEPGITYYFQAYVKSGKGMFSTSSIQSFTTNVPVSGISLNETSISLAVGSSVTLTATVSPSNATYKNVTWSSSNTSVATVTNGTVTANAAGKATITALASGKTATCSVTVYVPVSGVSLNQSSLILNVGDSYTLTATVTPFYATNKDVTWSSSNTSVATVSKGTVKAIAEGTATITAKAGDKSATCMVTVEKKFEPEAVDLGLSVKWATCNVGAKKPEEYGDFFAWGETEPKNDYSWSTYKWHNGDYNLLTKYNTDSSYGTVDNKTILDLSDDAASANWGASWRIPTRSEFQELIDNCTWTWTSLEGRNGYRVTSNKNGNSIFLPAAGCYYDTSLQAVGSRGNYWSSYLDPDYPVSAWELLFYSSSLIMDSSHYYGDRRFFGQPVRPVYGDFKSVSRVSLDRTSLTLAVGSSAILTATVNPSNASEKTITWSSSNISVATVTDGTVKAVAAGTATITAMAGNKTATCKVTVEVPVSSVSLNYTSLTLTEGESFTLTATVSPSNATNKAVSWSSSNTSVATVSNGSVRAVAAGTVTITAKAGDKTATCKVTVQVPATGVSLNYTSLTLNVNQSFTLTATVSPSNTTDKTVTWTSSDTSVATVSNGTVTGKAGGTATITAKAGDKTATCKVTVQVPATGVSLNYTSLTLNVNQSFTLTATVSPSNTTDKTVTWTSSDTSVATVSNGTIMARSAGTSVISAKAGNITALCTVSVMGKQTEPIAVDLGLSVKWANINIGANSPEEYGDYFAWGETSPKTDYSWVTYKWCKGNLKSFTKYNNNPEYGILDNRGYLELSDDAARVNWGEKWRMPTDAEMTELILQCTWTNETRNGKIGCLVTSKKNGNSIFLPCAGYLSGVGLYDSGYQGYYWSSSLETRNEYQNWAFCIQFYYMPSGFARDHTRSDGLLIRPVYGDPVRVSSIKLIRTQLSLNVGDKSERLAVSITPDNASEKGIRWTSSAPSVASVDNYGEVTAASPGTAIIMATTVDGYYSASCTVTVNSNNTSGSENGHVYVDLGLPSGVKWATCNVGANSPEEYGDYYAWGEISTKSDYSWNTYKWCNGTYNSLTKYNTNSSLGTVDNKTILDLSDDVARSKWGGKWRMPTKAECDELRTKCTWTWTSQGGKNGYRVTGKNGNSIFMPAAGDRENTSVYSVGNGGFYLSSSLSVGLPDYEWSIFFNSSGINTNGYNRCDGFSVRPVTE